MKIAVFHNLPSGGAKRMMFEIIRQLAGQHEFHVFTLSTANHQFCDIRPYVKTHTVFEFSEYGLFHSPFGRLNQLVRWINLNRLIQLNKKIAKQIDEGNFDFVWVNPCQTQNSPAVLNSIHKTPKLFLCQEPLRILYEEMPLRPYDKVQSRIKKFLDSLDPLRRLFFGKLKANDNLNIHRADLILVNSNFMNQSVAKVYSVQPKTNSGGVDIHFFAPDDLAKENFLFSVGSLTPLKGFDFLIRAIATLPETVRLPIYIASNFENPPEKNYLEQLAKELNVQLKLFVGISDQLLKELYNKAKLTVYAPVREPFGLVTIESMACGTAVVGVAEGGLIETVQHEKTGLLTSRNELEFGRAIQTLLDNPKQLTEFENAGQIYVTQNWSWEKSARNFEKHFQTLMNASAADLN
jgi:glycosyltransferase involved in cell wall biosynthesis